MREPPGRNQAPLVISLLRKTKLHLQVLAVFFA